LALSSNSFFIPFNVLAGITQSIRAHEGHTARKSQQVFSHSSLIELVGRVATEFLL
jgi:hypothetical protein